MIMLKCLVLVSITFIVKLEKNEEVIDNYLFSTDLFTRHFLSFFILQTFSPRLIIMSNHEHKTLLIQLAKLFTYYNSLDHSRSFKHRENSSQF